MKIEDTRSDNLIISIYFSNKHNEIILTYADQNDILVEYRSSIEIYRLSKNDIAFFLINEYELIGHFMEEV
jgi:hypothetical protein